MQQLWEWWWGRICAHWAVAGRRGGREASDHCSPMLAPQAGVGGLKFLHVQCALSNYSAVTIAGMPVNACTWGNP